MLYVGEFSNSMLILRYMLLQDEPIAKYGVNFFISFLFIFLQNYPLFATWANKKYKIIGQPLQNY